MESIRRYGFVDPVIIDQRTGYLLSGHGRTDALRGLRSEQPNEPPDGIVLSAPPQCRWLVPTIHVRSRDDAHARALLVALNRTVELGGWDDAALTELLADLARTNDGLAGTGYDGDDLDAMLADLAEPDYQDDDEPDNKKPWPHRAAADCTVTVLHGDCIEQMATLDTDSVDALVTDPPYGIDFMGRAWDRYTAPEFAAWCQKWSEVALRVVKPGGHLVAFGATRTHHRLMQGLEDAGWEIRDCGVWLYRSGFPKSHNLDGEWEGWGTALKPAIEPWVLARKPVSETSVAANVQRWGTGALNIDACRAAMTDEDRERWQRGRSAWADRDDRHGGERKAAEIYGEYAATTRTEADDAGRWPANALTVEDDDDLRFFRTAVGSVADYPKASSAEKPWDATRGGSTYTRACRRCDKQNFGPPEQRCECTEPDWIEQDTDLHPTVKPLDLMRHIVRLVTPPGGTVLDPFGGTGSTGEAAIIEGFDAVLIERDNAYLPLIQRRIDRTQQPEQP